MYFVPRDNEMVFLIRRHLFDLWVILSGTELRLHEMRPDTRVLIFHVGGTMFVARGMYLLSFLTTSDVFIRNK